ncbi:uncharacterized protein LOC131240877 [Magnolia sinica]|uniref:uncharacterized protein LOC131240877 n=1 Tax=Magnolia sinica TaxID=86752 RepID=UPI00265AD7E9|nr:uncharacterized protein LOC131240877 [Magnolia sinica]
MMRYQRVSPDYLPLSNGRKPNLRTCKEDDGDSRRILNYSNGFEGKALRFRPGTAPSTSQDQNFSQFAIPHSPQPENHTDVKSPNNHESGPVGDVLLQWGQNKRSRGSRADNRLVTDESSVQARQGAKIHRRVVSRVEKLATAMHPPCTTPYSRGANLRPCMPVREPTGSLPSRGLEEQSGPGNGPPPSNARINSRSTDKWSRSPPSPGKPDKTAASSMTALKEKPNGSVTQANPMKIESTPQSEPEPGATGEKLNFDIFEWPRIYISLSRKEKEDDFLIMKGTKLPQRPKKRAKNVDRALQYCFPGMWLSDLSRGRYEVREKKCVKKKRRGLKGMESMDSDSE